MDIDLELSANYAEVRTNRFHSGVDIRTGGREGIPVKAVADGYISRLGVVPTGFGRVVYISHPNGKTSVYAHLQRFTPELEQFASDERYRLNRNTLDAYLTAAKFPVKAGQLIGYSGNSGMSFGPHLHFEMRNSANQRTQEPIAVCGLKIPDNVPPKFLHAYYVAVDTVGGVPMHGKPQRIHLNKRSSKFYTASDTTAVEVATNGYFLVQVADEKDGGSSNMAVRRIEQVVDGETTLVVGVDGYLFDQSRSAASMTYYPIQKDTRYDVYKLAVQQGNYLPVYSNVKNRGVLQVSPGQRRSVEITLTDDCGLQSKLIFNVVGSEQERVVSEVPQDAMVAHHNRAFSYSSAGAAITIPIAGLFETMYYTQAVSDIEPKEKRGVTVLSGAHRFHDPIVPINRSATINISADVPERLRSKAALAIVDKHGSIGHAGGKYKSGGVEGTIRTFGNYCVVADTLAPTVVPSFSAGANLRDKRSITFTLKDNFSGIASVNATIDGKWALLERDVLKSTVTHHFDTKRFPSTGGRHEVVVEVADWCGNKTTFRGAYVR